MIFLDLKNGPSEQNKKENNLLLKLIPKINPIKNKK